VCPYITESPEPQHVEQTVDVALAGEVQPSSHKPLWGGDALGIPGVGDAQR